MKNKGKNIIYNAKPLRIVCLFLVLISFPSIIIQAQELKRIVIDAGHGGKDPGAIGITGVKEKDVVLNIAKKTAKYLRENYPDIEVILTRDADFFLELHERSTIANKNDADLFVSIHANSAGSSSAHGSETYVLGLHRTESNLDVAKRENAVVELEDNLDEHYQFNPNTPEGHIMMSMAQNAYLEQSIELASNIQTQFTERVKRHNRGVRQAGFYVLYKTTMPSILIELGFLSNREEEKFLNSVTGQDYMASAIYRAIKDYKFHVDGMWAENKKTKEEFVQDKLDKEGRVYRIQVYASKNPACDDCKVNQDFKHVLIEQASNGIYRHVVNSYSSYDAAASDLLNVVKKGYKGAYIVAYKDGKRVQVYDVTTNY